MNIKHPFADVDAITVAVVQSYLSAVESVVVVLAAKWHSTVARSDQSLH